MCSVVYPVLLIETGAESLCEVQVQYRGEPFTVAPELVLGMYLETLNGFIAKSEGEGPTNLVLGTH